MTIRSLGLAVFLVSMAAACQQKMAPADEPADGDSTAKSDDTTMPAGGDTSKDKPADKPAPAKTDNTTQSAPAKTDAPAPAPAPAPKTTTPPAPADDAKNDPTDPEDVGACLAQCKDPDCASKCFGSFGGGGDNPFGF